MCEAYVTLGRLSHVKERHSHTTATMSRSLIDAGAGTAVEAAMSKVRSEYEALKERLERLYRRSMGDLNAHKLTVEGPTLARIELVAGQQNAVEKAEDELKVLMANPDEQVVLRELPGARRRATKTLKSSIKLLGLRLPEVRPVTVADFPRSRLHNVVLANKPSGDQGQSKDRSSDGASKTTHQQRRRREQRHQRQPRQQQERRPGTPSRSSSQPLPMEEDNSSSSQSNTAAAAAAAAVREEEKAAAASMAVEGQSCCRAVGGTGGRSTAGWDEEGGRSSAGVPPSGRTEGAACPHCACACRADDVWAAYRTLRKRYHALKDQADKEELRVSVEEQRIGMQSEFDLKRGEMQAEFDESKREMDEELARRKQEVEAEAAAVAAARLECTRAEQAAAAAVAEARAREAAAKEGSMSGPSQMELQSLREIVQALFKESHAVHEELTELRGKVAVGEASMHEAQRRTLFLEEEVARRKQHGEILLARIRFLKGKTAAYVENNDFGVAQEIGGSRAGVEPNPRHPHPSSSTPPESDYGSDSDIDAIARRNQMAAAAAAACSFQDGTADRRQRGPFARSDSDSDAESSSESDVSYDALRHPAFPRRSSADGRDEDDFHFPPEELPRARGAADWMEVAGRYLMESGSGREGESGDSKARRLEREREHLTREVHKLSAQLASSGVTASSAGSSVAPDRVDRQPRRFFASPVAAPVVGGSPPRSRGRQQGQAAAMAAAAAAEAAEVAVAAVGRAAKDDAEPRRRRASRRQRGDGGGGSARGDVHGAPAGDGGVHRRRQPRETTTPNKRGRSPAAVLSGSSFDDSDGGSATSGSRSVSGSPSWRTVPRRRQESPTLEKVFHSQPQRQRQRRERGREWQELSAQQENPRAAGGRAFFPWGQVSSGHGLPEVFDDSSVSDGTSSGDSAETSGDQFW
ncbi:unnamed protein product [Scytosiphon promiscuus]